MHSSSSSTAKRRDAVQVKIYVSVLVLFFTLSCHVPALLHLYTLHVSHAEHSFSMQNPKNIQVDAEQTDPVEFRRTNTNKNEEEDCE